MNDDAIQEAIERQKKRELSVDLDCDNRILTYMTDRYDRLARATVADCARSAQQVTAAELEAVNRELA